MGMKRSVVEALEREERVFIRVPRKKRTLRIPISYSSSTAIMESPTREETLKAEILDGPSTESPTKPTKNSKKRPLLFPPTEQQPNKAKSKANGRFEPGASSSGTRVSTPEWLVRLMRAKNGENPKNIINKVLTATDVNSNNNRLSMPFSQIIDIEFLSPAEERFIEEDAKKARKEGIDATLVASDLREFEVNFRRWDMRGCPLYNLVKGWNKVVEDCPLKENDNIHLWSFHANGELYFAFVPPLPTDSNKSKSETKSSTAVIKEKPNNGLPHKHV